ncbi:MAG: type I-F CRISPR-associated protein Csy3 [Gammaproteobacteria bacterium]|nr:MAG: type I-F CRISPR-associated protein Csy3 [Gammaproteobacteria bacterium]
MAKKGNIATVLAFEKKLVPSDGFMYGTTWGKRHEDNSSQPLKLLEKSVRGTISNRLKAAIKNDPLKLNAEVEKPNLQRVDSCALGTNQDTLKLNFTLKVLSGVQQPSACNHHEFNSKYTQAAEAYIESEGFTELAKRYAINIANARFLWRNRVGVENIEVNVKTSGTDQQWTFDASKLSTRDFSANSPDIAALAGRIAAALSGKTDFVLLEINAYAQVGKAQDIYPSEELVLDKSNSKGGKSKILYNVNNVAAMHSQKIGNALRTIDTWYPDFEEVSTGPIAIEPYGAVTNLGIAYRNPKAKADFFTLFDKFALGEELENKNDEHYVMAVLVRGGVFGESGKE